MSAKLSQRYGRVCLSPPLTELPPDESFLLNQLTLDRRTEFEDLPPRYQQLILEAEADLERYRAEVAPLGRPAPFQRPPAGAERPVN